jgi:hypothetical protein
MIMKNTRARFTRLASFAATALAVSWALSACTAADATQCAVDSDCEAILGVGPGAAQCNAGVCGPKIRVPTDIDAAASATPCTSNHECVQQNGGQPALCRADRCIPVLTDTVIDATDNYKDQDPILLGFVAPLTTTSDGRVSASDATYFEGVKLAVHDWDNGSQGGINTPGTPARHPIGAVFCDSKLDATTVQSCVDHMIDLKVPAIVFRTARDASAALPHALASKTLVYCSDCEATDLPATATNGLLWFGAPALDDQIPIRVDWIQRVEADLRSERGLSAGATIKVAYLSSAEHVQHATNFKSALTFNGVSADANGPSFLWKSIDRASYDWHALGGELAAFAPDIIVTSEMGSDFHFYVVPEVEARWGAGPKPRYVASEDESFDARLRRTVGSNDGLRSRITGVWSALPSDAVIDNEETFFEDAFEATYGYRPGGVATGFESFYALSFGLTAALAGAQTSVPTGENLAAGMKELVGGAPEDVVDFKASEIPRGISILQSKKKIDARGVYTDLEWDPITGIVHAGAGIWCPSREDDGTIEPEELWTYDEVAKAPIGDPDLDVCHY